MFDVTILREKTDGDHATESREGVVDLKTNPLRTEVKLTYKNDRDSETIPFDNLHIESPLK